MSTGLPDETRELLRHLHARCDYGCDDGAGGMRVVGVIGWGCAWRSVLPLPFSIYSAFLVIAVDFGSRTMLAV
jgi:hypothetical protein